MDFKRTLATRLRKLAHGQDPANVSVTLQLFEDMLVNLQADVMSDDKVSTEDKGRYAQLLSPMIVTVRDQSRAARSPAAPTTQQPRLRHAQLD